MAYGRVSHSRSKVKAMAKRGGYGSRNMTIDVRISRALMKPGSYVGEACLRRRHRQRHYASARCSYAEGNTPTKAFNAALRHLAKLKK